MRTKWENQIHLNTLTKADLEIDLKSQTLVPGYPKNLLVKAKLRINQSHSLRRKGGNIARPLIHHPQALVLQTLRGQEKEERRSSPLGDQEHRGEILPPLAPPVPQTEVLRDVHQDPNLLILEILDLKPEAHWPGRDHQDLAQGHQDVTRDLNHPGVIKEVIHTPGPRRDLQGQSGEGQDPRHHVAPDLLLEDTEVGLPRSDIDLTHDLALHATYLPHP